MNINELKSSQSDIADKIDQQSISDAKKNSDSDITQLVSFMIDDVEYGINILAVHEILRFPELTRLPNTPKFIKGVINLRGNVIPVVDVRIRFGYPKGKITDLTRIIVIETNDKLVGLLVDNVYQVVRLPNADIDPPSELVEGVSEEFIKGIGRLHNRLIIILNLSNILFLEDVKEKVGK